MRALAIVLLGCASAPSSELDAGVEPADIAVEDIAAESSAPIDTSMVIDTTAPSCPTDMVAVDTFCIDRYEAPNIAGEKPLAFQTAPEGEAWCKARGKRLCSEKEWVRACEGASKRPYPYGTTYKRSTCNDDKTWIAPNWTTLGTYPSEAAKKEAARLYQADSSGARTGCTSEDSVMDLTGNVAEWVTRSFPNANNYEHVMKGCYWSGCFGGSPPSCGFVNPAHPGTFRTYEAGFRCCRARD
jgi:formylglycine-generating enzyme required for sulfatase activity